PSYRFVVDKDSASLQTWGIVQNLSGEDWTNVSLSLVAEAPLAFDASLATPVIPSRPTITDGGEVMAVVPHSETSLAEAPPPPPPPAPAAQAAPAMPAPQEEAKEYRKNAKKGRGPARSQMRGGGAMGDDLGGLYGGEGDGTRDATAAYSRQTRN